MGFSPIAWSRGGRLRPYLAVAAAVALAAGAAAGATAASATTSSTATFAGYHAPATVSTTLYRGSTMTPLAYVLGQESRVPRRKDAGRTGSSAAAFV